jgi:hypothetical protein
MVVNISLPWADVIVNIALPFWEFIRIVRCPEDKTKSKSRYVISVHSG